MPIEELNELNELIKFMDEHGSVELEIEKEGRRIRLKRGSDGGTAAAPGARASSAPARSGEQAPPGPGPVDAAQAGLLEIKAPMIGSFYRAAAPDAEPFVDVGDPVGPDTAVRIVEAMKVMNEVPAGCSGTIKQICVENAEPVEFGQVLFLVQP